MFSMIRRCAFYGVFFTLFAASPVAAFAASSGLDTPSGVNELPLSVNGVTGMDIVASDGSPTQIAPIGTNTPNVVAAGNLTTGGYMLPALAVVKTACSPNGLIGHDSTGAPLNCINGTWNAPGTTQGTYLTKMITANGQYGPKSNATGHIMVVLASGGNGGCADEELTGYVDGQEVGIHQDNNQEFGKLGSLTFFVPNGSKYEVTSQPYACGVGTIDISEFELN